MKKLLTMIGAAAVAVGAMFLTEARAETKEAVLMATGYTGSTTLTNFQALVKLSATDDAYGFSYAEAGGVSATNIWFTSEDGASVYPHEIDTWNTSGDSFVWVRVPELTNRTVIKMHWSDDENDVQTTTENVWANFVGVWHMNGTSTAAEPDKTGNGLDATPLDTSNAATSINTGTGVVGTGRVNANNKHLTVGSSTKSYWGDGRLTDKTKFSISGWFQWATDSTHPRLVSACTSSSDLNTWEIFYLGNSGKEKVLRIRSGDGSANNEAYFANTSIPLGGSYVYLTVVWNGANVSVYKDGTAQTQTDGSALSNSTHKDKFEIGGFGDTGDRSFIGKFDEVRMFDGAMTADRVAADYTTMHTPATFLTLVSDNTPVTAAWTGDGNDGDVSNAANWACTNSAGTGVSGLPAATTDVTVSGDNLNIQIPSGSSFQCKSFTLGNCSLAADCDLCGVGTVTIPSGVTLDLKDRALFVQSLAGDGVITNTANGTYTTLDFIRADNSDGSQYIITDYTPRYSDTFLTKVNFQNQTNQCIYCARGGSVSSGSYSCLTYGGDGRPLRFDHVAKMGDSGVAPVPALDTDYEFIVNGKTGVCKLNGTNVYTMATSDDDTATAASALSFFVLNNNANGTALKDYAQANFKMYFFRIYGADGALIRDYVPAKNGNGVAGLWERVGNTFLPSAGGTAFIAGNETGRGELVFHVPSGATATRSGVTIAVGVKVTKEGAGTLAETKLGYDKTKAGDYCLREGAVSFGPSTSDYLDLGPTNFCVSGGTLTSSSSILQIGRERNGCRFTQTGGTVSMSSYDVYVGIRASAEYDLTGGELNGVKFCYLGYGNNAVGTMRVSGGKMNAADFRIGANGTGHGDVLQNGGEVTTTKLSLPAASTATGAYDFSGGTLTINDNALVGGNSGRGSFFQSGGSCTVKGYPWIGADANSVGLYEMTGGTLTASSQPVSVGRYGTGTLNVSGSAVVTASKGIRVGFTDGTGSGSGTLVVTNGGTIATSSIYGGGDTDAQATVTFSNATVKVTAAGEILKDLHDVTISAGGLTITNDFAVSITNTTLKVTPGMTAITMTGSGSLDLSNASVELLSVSAGKFTLAVATGEGTFNGVPGIVRADGTRVNGYEVALSADRKRIEIAPRGFIIIVE